MKNKLTFIKLKILNNIGCLQEGDVFALNNIYKKLAFSGQPFLGQDYLLFTFVKYENGKVICDLLPKEKSLRNETGTIEIPIETFKIEFYGKCISTEDEILEFILNNYVRN